MVNYFSILWDVILQIMFVFCWMSHGEFSGYGLRNFKAAV
jgi:hypothetical protein